jgi:photosystem II stability/assembly factor-like uncharacterized protein
MQDTLYVLGGITYQKGEIITLLTDGSIISHDSISPKAIYGGCYTKQHTILACGYDGKIFSSHMPDNSWHLYQTPEWIPLQDISHLYDWSVAVGGIAGKKGIIQVKHDSTWRWIPLTYERELKAVAIIDSTCAFAVGHGVAIKTINKGQSWTPMDIDGDIFTDIQFIDSKTGYILGYSGLLYKTENGGQSWNRLKINKGRTLHRGYYNDLYFADNRHGFICGNNGIILKTEDGGVSWQQAQHRFNADLYAIWYDKHQQTGIAAGSNGALILFRYEGR